MDRPRRHGEISGAKLQGGCGVDLNDAESYDYHLPEDLIAQDPCEQRDASRLMLADRESGILSHRKFSDLPCILKTGDLLVMNDTRVYKARLAGRKIPGGARVEILCLSGAEDPRVWMALVRPGRRLPPGTMVALENGLAVCVGERLDEGLRLIRLPDEISAGDLFESVGLLPLPPYITKSTADEERYQTVYSDPEKKRSAAAPTAGLHFTERLLDELSAAGIGHVFITLDVGIGTFRAVKSRNVSAHRMHGEACAIGPEQSARINEAKSEGRRVIAVGTTVVRALESFADGSGRVRPGEMTTEIFIRPGFGFKVTDALITNFHLPRSTLLMLVSAFAGYEAAMAAYREAVGARYRFFSFGDAMIII
ncbi:MAG: tRNA preQ1(34) S-adenosylmethionine ribosyltransferase-isomerase QueA [Synergistaceae bacterium]|nr:tRNA preQ1(34) S-adenosylmethionine ribosyltransferase-isomerase QueA [Synergistaceae bacterium]